MRIFKRRKKVVARTSHVHKKLLGRKGTPVNARIMSYPRRRFDDAYPGDESLIFKDSEGSRISQ